MTFTFDKDFETINSETQKHNIPFETNQYFDEYKRPKLN